MHELVVLAHHGLVLKSFGSCGTNLSESKRGCFQLNAFVSVGSSAAKQNKATLNHILQSVKKPVDIAIHSPQHCKH